VNHAAIEARFNGLVGPRYRTVLLGGAAEPLYVPATKRRPAIIRYTRDYAQSALHELAHWCIAGVERRARADSGYWYEQPPRLPAAQTRFFDVESRVQGLELLLAQLADVRFHVSVDDPDAGAGDFEARVIAQAVGWRQRGFTARMAALMVALCPDWQARLQAFDDSCGRTTSGSRPAVSLEAGAPALLEAGVPAALEAADG